jgi:formate C-acetyltransferase
MMVSSPGFAGHITPGCDQILLLGTDGFRMRINDQLENLRRTSPDDPAVLWYETALLSLDSVDIYAERLREACEKYYIKTGDSEFKRGAEILERVPKKPAQTFREALQSYWIIHVLITIEMGGCVPGGGIGMGRPDQYLCPFYINDIENGILTREQALEYMELFLLNFTHNDYYTWHQIYTPGTQGSLCGITPHGFDAFNDLSELIMEASARINMPAPYISIRLNKKMSERALRTAANFITCGLGFPVVNDEVLIPAMLKHGRSLYDANDYICSCCYENTIPGRESFNPSAYWFNSAIILELLLNGGKSMLSCENLCGEQPVLEYNTFDELLSAYIVLMKKVLLENIDACNRADKAMIGSRAYPLMSVFIDDCIASGTDVVDGGARYDLTGIIVAGMPNLINSLAAVREVVYEQKAADLKILTEALKADFDGYEELRGKLLKASKWGNGDNITGEIAKIVTDELYAAARTAKNARDGRYQLALYSFVANNWMGQNTGALPDGRKARQNLTRNMNPTWGTDKKGPTAVLRSLSHIDMTQFPNGSALDLRFDPALIAMQDGRDLLGGFLMGMTELGVMQVQLTFADTETLLDARANPEKYPNLLVKAAGYSARFIDLSDEEKDEIIGRSKQRLN